MTGHIIYACLCLNVQIQLANKYYLEGHENYRKEKFQRLEQHHLSGWIFDAGKGIVITYPSLIRIRKHGTWFTINCHNCVTEVCSIERKGAEELETTRQLPGDRLMIHQKTIFGKTIDDLRKKPTYSDIFHIILSPDLPMEYLSIDKDKNFHASLQDQYKQVQRLLKKSCNDLERQTELKIQEYQEEQKLQLIREKEKANYDAAVLWQTMKEVSKTSTSQNSQRLTIIKAPNFVKISDHLMSARIEEAEKQAILHPRDLPMDAKEYDMFQTQHTDHLYHPHESDPNHFINQRRRRSSVFKTSNRRTSYILDESAIANSLKKICYLPLVPVPERKRTSLRPPDALKTSSSCSSWEDESDKEMMNDEGNDDSEEMFPLDEDITENYTFNNSKRRESKKYLDTKDEDEMEENRTDSDQDDELGITQKPDYTIACSVPISIERSPCHMKSKNQNSTLPKQTFLGFDYAKADRELSSHLPPVVEYRRKSIAYGALHCSDALDTQDTSENIIPPHILVANTYTDGTKAMFGSVPRGSVRYRPAE